ncbi:MAG: tripartite-type tricarboxylate transporter receptor subunit TctC [Halieaceae bacterium]|jgi:tripartite-type tricarboxylate transporter receptor subunit TctC
MKILLSLLVGLGIAMLLTPQGGIESTGFPQKPVTLIVPYSPGGAVDTIGRTVAKYIEQYLGQRVIVRNKPGAGGEIGYRSLSSSNPDGYTMGMITAPPILMLQMIRESSASDISGFEVLASIQKDPVVLAVAADSPFKTLIELLEAARNVEAGVINVAGDGPLSNNQLQLVVAESKFNVDFNFVPFSGSGPSISALVGGQVHAAVPSASSVTNFVNRGDVRALAVFSPERYEFLPQVPTVFEATGVEVPDIGAAVRGIVVPVGLPVRSKQLLIDTIEKLMVDAEFIAHARKVGIPLHYMSASDFTQYLVTLESQLGVYMPLLSDKLEQAN